MIAWMKHRLPRLALAAAILATAPLGCSKKADTPTAGPVPAAPGAPPAIAATPEAAKAEFERIAKFLPNDCPVVIIARLDAILKSKAMTDIDKAVPGTLKKFESKGGGPFDSGSITPGNVAAAYMALSLTGEPFRIFITKTPVTRESILFTEDPDRVRDVKVGEYTMLEKASWRFEEVRPGEKSAPKYDGTGAGTCIVDPTLVVMGQARDLKAVLERNKPLDLSPSFLAAMQKTDLSKPIAIFGSAKDLRGKPGPWEKEPILKSVIDAIDFVTGQVTFDDDIAAAATIGCKDEKSATEMKQAADGGLFFLRNQKDTPKEFIDSLSSLKLEVKGSEIVGSYSIKTSIIAGLIKKEQGDENEPTYFGRPLSRMIEQLKSERMEARRSAAQDIGNIGPEAAKAVPDLAKLLKDPEKDVRIAVAIALDRVGTVAGEAVPALVEALKDDKEMEVRKYSAQALGSIGGNHPAAVEALAKALEDPNRDIRSYATSALGKIGPTAASAVPALIGRAKDKADPDIQGYAISALGSIGAAAKDAIPTLIEELKSGSRNETVGRALAQITDAPPKELIDPLTGSDTALAKAAAAAVGEYGERAKGNVGDLLKVLTGANSDAANTAGYAIAKIGPAAKDSVPDLIKAIEKGTPGAIIAVRGIGPDAAAAVPAIVSQLSFDEIAAIDALAAIGPAAKDALPKLKSLDARNKESLAIALWKIGDPDAAVDILVGLMKPKDSFGGFDAEAAAKRLGEMGPAAAKAVPALMEAAKPPADGAKEDYSHQRVRETAVTALGQIGAAAKPAIPTLIATLKEHGSSLGMDGVSKRAARALGQMGPAAAEAIPALVAVFNRRDYGTEEEIMVALARIGGDAKKAVPLIEDRSSSDYRKLHSGFALWKLDGQADKALKAAISAVKKPMESEDRHLLAIEILKGIGPQAKPAADALVLLAKRDSFATVRAAAADALRTIDPEAAAKAGLK